MLQDEEKAKMLFDEIIEKGNSTYYVESAREYLEEMNKQKG